VKRNFIAVLGILALLLAGCTGLTSAISHPSAASGQLVVSPSSAIMRGGASQTFTAQINGAATAVSWSVNGVAGGTLRRE
jgi:hypothetical protein